MFKSLRSRVIVILAVLLGAGWQLYDKGLKLGLDLQGGMHLVLEVDDPDGTMTAEAKADMIDRVDRIIRTRIDELGVEEPLIQQVGGDRLIVELAGMGAEDQERAKALIQETAYLEFKLVHETGEISDAVLRRLDRAVVTTLGVDSIVALGRDVRDPGSAGGPSIDELLFNQGGQGDSTAADTASATDPDPAAQEEDPLDALRPFTSLLNQGDLLGTFLVAQEDLPLVEEFIVLPDFQRALPRGVALHLGVEDVGRGARLFRRLYVLDEEPFMTGESLENAVAQRDPQFNQAIVQFELDRAGGRQFGRFTGQHVGDFLAIVLDGEVMSAPSINSRIGSRGQIEMGNADLAEARDLALVLRAGALPARVNVIEERTVGPSLGRDSVEQGRMAGIVGLVLVVLIMLAYYRMAGVLAVGALAVYVALVLGGLAGIEATLTVPGIAGLILSIGMAVDANVLIFERIREELQAGRATRTAVDEGFANALSAIVDANITTLITALILFQFGTGPVRGFAVTLSIGIVASFFSALYVTRSFFLLYLRGKRASDPISI